MKYIPLFVMVRIFTVSRSTGRFLPTMNDLAFGHRAIQSKASHRRSGRSDRTQFCNILTQSALKNKHPHAFEKPTASVKSLALTMCVKFSSYAQVAATLHELANKQEDLDQREKASDETRVEMATPTTSSATAAAGAEPPESKRQSVVTASSTENGGSGGTTSESSSKEAPILAPQEHNDSEAMDASVAPSDGDPKWVEYWDESTDASYFYNTVTQVECQDKEGEIRGGGKNLLPTFKERHDDD